MAEISVIVPVYKVEPYLYRCVDSILAQTFADFELILVDDGSPDHCGEICDEYAQKDSRVHVIHQMNGGLSVARNVGIDWMFANSDSKWLTLVDSDDWIHPQYLEILLQAANDSGKAISMCKFVETETDLKHEKQKLALRVASPGEAYTYNSECVAPNAWGRLYAKTCFDEIRYPCGKIHEDMATTYKLLYAQDEIAIAENTLYYYYVRMDSIIRKKWHKGNLDYLEACEEQFTFLVARKDCFALDRLREAYLRTIHFYFQSVQESEYSSKEKNEYSLYLRKVMRKALKDHGKQISVSVENAPWYYEMAYPRLMYVYWFVKAQLNKIKRK